MSKKETNTIDFGTFDLAAEAAKGIDVIMIDERTKQPFIGSDGKEIVITIQGMDSDKWQDTAKKIGERNTAKYKRRGVPSDVVEDNLKEVLATVTLHWSNNIPFGGETLTCTYDNCLKLYKMPNAFAEQLIAAGTTRASLKKA